MKLHHLALIFALLANASANILIKSGTRKLALENLGPGQVLAQILTSVPVMAGILLFGVNVLSYAYALNKIPLSQAYPIMTSVGFLIVVSASVFLFGEVLDKYHVLGLALILAGVLLISSRLS
jgi:multidrug transporter EmrE-like cation transporter